MPIHELPHEYLQAQRNAYAYPAVALDGNAQAYTERDFETTHALDHFLHSQLVSENAENKLMGYLAVIFWGHYSGKNGQILRNRALGKVRLAYEGHNRLRRNGDMQRIRGVLDLRIEDVLAILTTAIGLVHADQFGDALNVLSELPGIGMAFASKLCAFIDPSKCGVIDSVIVASHPRLGFSLTGKYVSRTISNFDRYDNYCQILREVSNALNADERFSVWTDRDGQQHPWRAVDVERALY